MQRITYFERQIIQSGLRVDKPVRAIARCLGRDHRVIQREINRNSGECTPYIAVVAQRIHGERQRKKNTKKLEKECNSDLRKYVIRMLNEDWSPEQIEGVLKEYCPTLANGKTISYESIYQYIYEGEGKWEHLWPHLRKGRKKRKKRHARKPKNMAIPSRISIHDRAEEINSKTTFGHWESDTIEFGNNQREKVSVQYERKSQLLRIHKTKNKTAEETENAIRKSLDTTPLYLWKSITFDNGGESATHTKLRDDFGLQTFHCDAFASWQKGGVENSNGLLRQYLPRTKILGTMSETELNAIQEKLNNRPRKSLNFLSPNQIIAREVGQ